jgi:hypothetical protein
MTTRQCSMLSSLTVADFVLLSIASELLVHEMSLKSALRIVPNDCVWSCNSYLVHEMITCFILFKH